MYNKFVWFPYSSDAPQNSRERIEHTWQQEQLDIYICSYQVLVAHEDLSSPALVTLINVS